MKAIILFFSLSFTAIFSFAQDNKVVKKAQQVNDKTQRITETSYRLKEQANQVAANVNTVTQNAKAIIKIFEPVFAFHFKKKNSLNTSGAVDPSAYSNNSPAGQPQVVNTKTPYDNNTQSQPVVAGQYPSGANTSGNASAPPTYTDPGVPENSGYNPDGTANWGNQYNAEYGCYLDALTGTVLYGGEAEEKPTSVDLVFLAPNDGQNTYYLVTSNFAHDGGADCFWGSCTTDNPTKSWKTVNESEVALTTLNGAQFEKIQYNTQLSGAVKSTRGFAGWYSSPGSKLDGKVFAVKTEMENRTAYALIYVVKHVGTSGSGGHLKVKVKVTGFDNNADGNPDAAVYER